MIWSLSSKLEKLEPSHTRKFPRVNAQNSKFGPIQPWDVKDFLRPDRGGDAYRRPRHLGRRARWLGYSIKSVAQAEASQSDMVASSHYLRARQYGSAR